MPQNKENVANIEEICFKTRKPTYMVRDVPKTGKTAHVGREVAPKQRKTAHIVREFVPKQGNLQEHGQTGRAMKRDGQ